MFFRYCFIVFLFISVAIETLAQVSSPDNLLDINNEQIIGTKTSITYQGGMPAVLIEPLDRIENKIIPQNNTSHQELKIKTPFGHDRTAAFIDHTTDFAFLIQILDSEKIRIEEKIQLVNTKSNVFFQRVLSKTLPSTNNNVLKTKIELLNVSIDGKMLPFNIRDIGNALILTSNNPLSEGVHNITISYLVSGAIHKNRGVADISINLTGKVWPLLTERFTAIILFPNKTEVYHKELLFGSNQISIPESFLVQIDEKGNSIYQTTHLLPAFSEVTLHTIVDAQDIPSAHQNWLQKISTNLMLILVCLFTMILYTFATIASLIYKKRKHPLQDMLSINPILWKTVIHPSFTQKQMNDLSCWRIDNNNRLFGFSLVKYSFKKNRLSILTWGIIRLISFIRFNYEYLIGFITLIILTLGYMIYHDVTIHTTDIIILCSISIILSYIIHRFGVQKDLRNLKDIIKDLLLQKPQGTHLTSKIVTRYYPYAVCLGFEPDWSSHLLRNNPTLIRLTFLKKEKE